METIFSYELFNYQIKVIEPDPHGDYGFAYVQIGTNIVKLRVDYKNDPNNKIGGVEQIGTKFEELAGIKVFANQEAAIQYFFEEAS